MAAPQLHHQRRFVAAAVGTVAAALCCFTPILVIIFGAAGLGVISHYLDSILLPALALMILLTVVSYRQWKPAEDESLGGQKLAHVRRQAIQPLAAHASSSQKGLDLRVTVDAS